VKYELAFPKGFVPQQKDWTWY